MGRVKLLIGAEDPFDSDYQEPQPAPMPRKPPQPLEFNPDDFYQEDQMSLDGRRQGDFELGSIQTVRGILNPIEALEAISTDLGGVLGLCLKESRLRLYSREDAWGFRHCELAFNPGEEEIGEFTRERSERIVQALLKLTGLYFVVGVRIPTRKVDNAGKSG